MRTTKLLTALAIAMVVSISGCKKDDFVEIAGVCPAVISTSPASAAVGVSLDKIITATFNEAMNSTTITQESFTLGVAAKGVTSVEGTVSYTGMTASFIPTSPLAPSTDYTGKITTAVKDLMGNAIQTDYVWTFTTGPLPLVISVDPANNSAGIDLNKVVTANFSVPMDPLTLTATTFTLKQGVIPVYGTISYAGSTARFTPFSSLLSNTNYTATITTGAKSAQGIPLSNNFTWKFSTGSTASPLGVDLKSAGLFGILAGVGISNNAGLSEIHNMDVGISPGVRSSVTGFPPAIMVGGVIYASDDAAPPGVAAMLIQAKQDLTDAYLFAAGATLPAPATVAGDQGGKTLAPGIYKSTSTLLIQSGDLTLDAQGDANAVWIFQIASDFTTVGGAGGSVILRGGAQAKNVYWQTGSSATIGDYTSFQGNILALTSITMNSHATATGRMLARNGSVILTSTNIINKP